MKFNVYINETSKHQKFYTDLLKTSLINNGLEHANSQNCDFYVTWAFKTNQSGTRWHIMKKTGKPILVMERGYIGDRMNEWTSIGWDGLNGRADFCNKEISDYTRFKDNFEKYMKPWKKYDKSLPVLLVGQCYHDASVSHVNIHDFYDYTISKLHQNGHTVIFRPHPLNREPYRHSIMEDNNKNVLDTFKNIKSVVTFSSNTGVLSCLEGIPTYSKDIGSMVYDVSTHDLNNLEYMPDRTDWASKIAYTQWNNTEIESGIAWKHLSQKIIK
jgi:hypothetical protein